MFSYFVFIWLVLFLGMIKYSEELTRFKFAHRAQILEQMVHMELRMEQLEAKMNQTVEKVQQAQDNALLTMDNNTVALKLLEDRVNSPMVAFHAYNPLYYNLGTSDKLILQSAELNLGGRYNHSNGLFTAPVSGLYLFTSHICNYSGRAFYYYIMLEGSAIAKSTKFNNVHYDCDVSSVLTPVTYGQRVWIQCASGVSYQLYDDSYRQTSFSGVLLHK